MKARTLMDESQRTEAVADAMASLHSGAVAEVSAAVQRDAVVVVGMAQNPFVKKARRALDEAGVASTYLEYGSYLGDWKKRLAIKLWSGWPTFPQVFVRGTLIGGANDTIAALGDGSLRARLDAE